MDQSKKSTGIIVGIIAVVLIGGGIFWAMNSSTDDTNTSSSSQTQQADDMATDQQAAGTIVDVASGTESLSTLVTAVTAADLVETLQGEGPFTVFAPTNAAFDALPAGTLETLLKPESKDQLSSILTYHVVAGKVMAADLSDGQKVKTVNGATLTVKITDAGVYLVDAKGNEVKVEKADVPASNGVVHVIGGVLLPS